MAEIQPAVLDEAGCEPELSLVEQLQLREGIRCSKATRAGMHILHTMHNLT